MTYNTEIYVEVGMATGISEAPVEHVSSGHLALIPRDHKIDFAIGEINDGDPQTYIVYDSILDINTLTQRIYLRRL